MRSGRRKDRSRRRYLCGMLLAGGLLLLLLLGVGCARPAAGRAGDVEITLWSMWSGQEEKNFQRVLRRYEQEHPGITFHNLGAVSDDTKTVRALVAGVPPDFFTLADP